jgi:hypothetical protein
VDEGPSRRKISDIKLSPCGRDHLESVCQH